MRLIVAEVAPCITRVAVVLAHRSPLAFAQVRAPPAPGDASLPRLRQALRLRALVLTGHDDHPPGAGVQTRCRKVLRPRELAIERASFALHGLERGGAPRRPPRECRWPAGVGQGGSHRPTL